MFESLVMTQKEKYTLGRYLREIMESRGWNPSDLHHATKVSRSYLVQIMDESNPSSGGKAPNVTVEKILQLSKGLGLSIMSFIRACDGDNPYQVEENNTMAYRHAFQALLKELPKEEKSQLVNGIPADELASLLPDDLKSEILRRVEERKN